MSEVGEVQWTALGPRTPFHPQRPVVTRRNGNRGNQTAHADRFRQQGVVLARARGCGSQVAVAREENQCRSRCTALFLQHMEHRLAGARGIEAPARRRFCLRITAPNFASGARSIAGSRL